MRFRDVCVCMCLHMPYRSLASERSKTHHSSDIYIYSEQSYMSLTPHSQINITAPLPPQPTHCSAKNTHTLTHRYHTNICGGGKRKKDALLGLPDVLVCCPIHFWFLFGCGFSRAPHLACSAHFYTFVWWTTTHRNHKRLLDQRRRYISNCLVLHNINMWLA